MKFFARLLVVACLTQAGLSACQESELVAESIETTHADGVGMALTAVVIGQLALVLPESEEEPLVDDLSPALVAPTEAEIRERSLSDPPIKMAPGTVYQFWSELSSTRSAAQGEKVRSARGPSLRMPLGLGVPPKRAPGCGARARPS